MDLKILISEANTNLCFAFLKESHAVKNSTRWEDDPQLPTPIHISFRVR